jgi:DNA-binding protein HU-beta
MAANSPLAVAYVQQDWSSESGLATILPAQLRVGRMDLNTVDLESDEPVACATPSSRASCVGGGMRLSKEALMKTTDLIDQVADKAGIARDAARLAVDVMLTSIVDAAKQGEEVSLPGFGKFKVKQSPARQGRNPATGQTIEIAASRKLGFAPAKQVKDALAG